MTVADILALNFLIIFVAIVIYVVILEFHRANYILQISF